VLLLFDKLIEGRETQAAESWRVSGLSSDRLGTERDSGESAFQAITTMAVFVRFRLRGSVIECEGARYAEILGVKSPSRPESKSLKSESLILAQNERWRQA
jgi:hypothetical protein